MSVVSCQCQFSFQLPVSVASTSGLTVKAVLSKDDRFGTEKSRVRFLLRFSVLRLTLGN